MNPANHTPKEYASGCLAATQQSFRSWLSALGLIVMAAFSQGAWAVTYVNAATTFNWIDATTHTKVGAATTPYQFRNTGGCGTTPPIIDDTLSDIIPIGFNFVFGDKVFDSIRIMSNGRIHFVSTTLPLDNTTCGFGSPVTQLPYANATLTYTMRIYGNDMDPTLLADYGGNATPCANSATCFVSFAMIGAAPNRQFVVTWNNIPEWANAASATGNYNLQIILNEAGDFIYQYGTDVAGPQAALAQVGWEVSASDFDVPKVGFPTPNTAVHFFIPHPVVEYLMEQPSWGGAGTVLDTSGNGQNGSPVGSAQTVAAGKVCRGASIPSAGTNAINSSITLPTSVGNAGTMAFWYKSNTAWTGADALLLDASTVNNQWFFLTRRGGGRLRFVITDNTGTARIAETAVIAVAAGTWKHIAVTWNFNNLAGGNNDLLTIFVDGVQQQTTFTSTTATLSAQIGSLYIGGTRASLSGPSGTTNSADGTLDEFRAYNYEAKLAFITTEMNLNTGGCLNHYAITDAGTGLSCQLSQFTIAPHTAAHAAFVNNALVTLTTSDNKGTWSLLNGHGTLTNVGINSGNATYLYNNESQVLLGFTHSTAATVTAHVTDGTYTESENTALVISNCAVGRFNACEVAATRCTPTAGSTTYANLYTKLANTAFALDIVAVAVPGGTLDATFIKKVSVKLLVNTGVPTINAANNCPTSQVATISLGTTNTFVGGRPPVGGVNVAAAALSGVAPNYSAYNDVRVQFVCTGAADCGFAGTWCATDAFTIRPQSLTISSSANADALGVSTILTPVVKAGTSASFTLTANTSTAGYNGTPKIDLTQWSTQGEWLSPPVGGRAAPGVGTLAGSFTAAATIATGNGSAGNFTYDEVGYFRLKAGSVYDGSYAATSGDVGNGDCTNDYSNVLVGGKYGCNVANQVATNYFGRFIPDHFAMSGGSLVNRSDFCPGAGCPSTFTYIGELMNAVFTLTAQNLGNASTQNYSGSFAKLNPLSAVTAYTSGPLGLGVIDTSAPRTPFSVCTATPTHPCFTPTGASTGSFANGVATNITVPLIVYRDATAVGPYTSLNIGIAPVDSDNVTTVYDLDTVNVVAGASNHTNVGSSEIRYGRMKITNAHGSEVLPLPMTATVQYWSGMSWVTSATDSVTNLVLGVVTGSYQRKTGGAWTVTPPSSNTVAGVLNYKLSSGGGTGSVNIQANAPTYLLPSTIGRATFGVYKGANEFIYLRENY
jgi:MSHA biogenesis protein MshQ